MKMKRKVEILAVEIKRRKLSEITRHYVQMNSSYVLKSYILKSSK